MDLTKTGYKPEEDYGTYGTPDALPVGDYKVAIVDSEERETKSGTGTYLRLVLEVLDGPHKGRKIFENLNLVNENPIAVRIARAELKAICVACGGLQPQDSSELHGIPMIVSLGQRKREDTGDMQNNVKKFKKMGEDGTAADGPAKKPADPGDRSKPWKK